MLVREDFGDSGICITYDTSEGLVSFNIYTWEEFTPQEMKDILTKMCEYLDTLICKQ